MSDILLTFARTFLITLPSFLIKSILTMGSLQTENSQLCKLSAFIAESQLTLDQFEQIGRERQSQSVMNSMLICVSDNKVMQPEANGPAQMMGPDTMVRYWSYEQWREAEAGLLANDYDLRRFMRSTEVETLCRKVQEHKQYSFIARIKGEGGDGQDSVMKYSFMRITPDASMILLNRHDITTSLEHDTLTGGLNREGLLRELTQKMAHSKPGERQSLLCFNIKNFRIINEMFGSRVGDAVLRHLYTAIVYSELHPVSYARYESDNFLCLVNRDTLDTEVVTRLCTQECELEDIKVPYRSLCGIYHLDDCTESAFDACSHAKMATSFIKDQFITPWQVFDPKMKRAVISDSEVLSQIDEALANREFVPYFQPVVNLQTGRVEMAEALVRWQSKKHGLVMPNTFIPVLERHGGLSRIDKLMEESIFTLQRQRVAQGQPVVPIDLNLSWTDFADAKLIDQLQKHILDPSVPTDLMCYEITESAYEEIAENRLDVLNFFQQNNVKLLVDDFGQGYSFGTMKNVDFHIVKLDKSMIDKLGQSRKMDLLVKTMIGVFHSLNSKVVAEGVETEQQLEYLRQAGCDFIQGYYYYKPMCQEDFLALIDKQNTTSPTEATDEAGELTTEALAESTILVDRDVLEEQNARLRQSVEEAKCLRMLLDEQDIYYFEWDVRTHDDIASDKFCRLYNLPSNVLHNMPEDAPLVHEEDLERFRSLYHRAERGEKMGYDFFRLRTPDGKGYTWYRKTFYTLFDQKGMPYKAIITMQDCSDKYRYRVLRTRDRMLIEEQELVTFVYTIHKDKLTINYQDHEGKAASGAITQFLGNTDRQLQPDQKFIANTLRQCLAEKKRSGYVDFHFTARNHDFRLHFAMVDGIYGIPYAIVGQAEDIDKTREYLNAKEQLLRLSEIDGLTQIYNRTAGERQMAIELEKRQPGVFVLLDCDNFKRVNDTFGHVTGDKLLVEIGRLMKEFNPEGINMRLGGDEFAMFLPGTFTPEQLQQNAECFFAQVDDLPVAELRDFPHTVSVGAVAIDGTEQADFGRLYHQADQLLYQSKRHPGNRLTT